MEWYNEYPHIGYDLDGKRILKPATADEVGSIISVLYSSHLIKRTSIIQLLVEGSKGL